MSLVCCTLPGWLVNRLLSKTPELVRLTLAGYENVTDDMTQGLILHSLNTLDLSYSEIQESAFIQLMSQPALQSLIYTCSKKLSKNLIEKLPALSLKTLNLDNSDITKDTLGCLLAKTLLLENVGLMSTKGLLEPFTELFMLPHLCVLDLSHCELSEGFLYDLLQRTPNLQKLNLANMKFTPNSNMDWSQFLPSLHQLEELQINKDLKFTYNLFRQSPGIKKLNMEGTDFTSLTGVADLDQKAALANLGSLESLNLSHSTHASAFLDQLASVSTQIKLLNLSHCKDINVNALLKMDLSLLRELHLADVDRAILLMILPRCPQLKSLYIDEKPIDPQLQNLVDQIPFVIKVPSITKDESQAEALESNGESTPHSHDERLFMDANTSHNPDKTLKAKSYFFSLSEPAQPLEVTNYRLKVFDNLLINPSQCSIKQAFLLSKSPVNDLQPVAVRRAKDLLKIGKDLAKAEKNASYILGCQKLALSPNWQALASFSPNETMTHLDIDLPEQDYELKYSEQDNLYYIRSKNIRQEVSFSFILKTQPPPPIALAPNIEALVKKCNNFTSGSLVFKYDTCNGKEYLDALITQEKGACRHRALVFKYMMKCDHPNIPTRIVTNDAHAFVEIYWEGTWVSRDLGGYSANLQIDESLNPSPSSNQTLTISVINNPELIEAREEETEYERDLETWEQNLIHADSINECCQILCKKEDRAKRLVTMSSSNDVNAMRLHLEAYCRATSRPIYYVDSPDDLVSAASFVHAQGNQGQVKQGPGGPFFEFLQAHKNQTDWPVLLVNYDHFDADDIIRFNTLLDEARHADGQKLPDDALVLGLINKNKPDCYQGSDFYSRMDKVLCIPFEGEALQQNLKPLPLVDVDEGQPVASIQLFHSNDWQERLLGQWVIHKDRLVFEEGLLRQAVDSGLPIALHNGLWEDPKFTLFWQQAVIRGYVETEVGSILIPDTLTLVRKEHYDWEQLSQHISFIASNQPPQILNPGCLSDFLRQYYCDGTMLDTLPGLIERHAHQTLPIYLTRTLSEDEWALLLDACNTHQVRLSCVCAPGVELPEALVNLCKTLGTFPRISPIQTRQSLVIHSSDIDTTVASYQNGQTDWQVIDVSECDPSDLIIQLNGQLNPETMRFDFRQTRQALVKALDSNQKVILHGRFSKELADALAVLILQRELSPEPKGHLAIVPTDASDFNFMVCADHQVTRKDKKDQLRRYFSAQEIKPLNKSVVKRESLSQLKARLSHLRSHPDEDSAQTWAGLMSLPSRVNIKDFDATQSAQITHAFNLERLTQVNQVLNLSPYVFLTGLTGVGKSTFVEENFHPLYKSEAQIQNWINDQTPNQLKILFIDEANLSPSQWSAFEGLFNDPPGILVQGVFHPLTKDHKVIFAGNPVSYGDARTLAPFFKRHGNAVVFEPLPQEFIYEQILKPVFKGTILESQALDLSLPLLDVYRFICECFKDKVLISPRELQMMALHTLTYAQNHHDANPEVARHYAYHLGKTLIPKSNLSAFEQRFKPQESLIMSSLPKETGKIVITRDMVPLYQQLNELFALRELRRNKEANKTQSYGGLGGIVIEGEPGIGKSALVIAALRANNYEECHDFTAYPNKVLPQKHFYRMPASFSTEEKKTLLLTAFHEGAVVVADEINAAPMMERFLNDLLMGHTPDKKRPDNPGFLLIGTQNPATMAGRRLSSTAIQRRLINWTLNSPKPDEMKAILIQRGLNDKTASTLIRAYEKNVLKAKRGDLNPAPVFRDVIHRADKIIHDAQMKKVLRELNKAREHPRSSNPGKFGFFRHSVHEALQQYDDKKLIKPY